MVIVADTREERIALAAGISLGSPILLASTISQARHVLAQLPGASLEHRSGAQRPLARTPSRQRGPGGPGPQHAGSDRPSVRRDGALRLREDRLSLAVGDREVSLTRLELALLRYLLPRVGEVATFEQLSQVGWHTAYLGNGAHMHAAVGRLRLKLAELGAPLALEAVRGLGFRLVRHPRAAAFQEAVGN